MIFALGVLLGTGLAVIVLFVLAGDSRAPGG